MFTERLDLLLRERHISRSKLLSDLKMGKNQFKYWETKGKPNMATVSAIAGYLHVDPEYLMGLSNTPEIGGAVRSTPDERLLDAFHQLNAEGKDLVLDYVERLTEKPRYTTETAIKVDRSQLSERSVFVSLTATSGAVHTACALERRWIMKISVLRPCRRLS